MTVTSARQNSRKSVPRLCKLLLRQTQSEHWRRSKCQMSFDVAKSLPVAGNAKAKFANKVSYASSARKHHLQDKQPLSRHLHQHRLLLHLLLHLLGQVLGLVCQLRVLCGLGVDSCSISTISFRCEPHLACWVDSWSCRPLAWLDNGFLAKTSDCPILRV